MSKLRFLHFAAIGLGSALFVIQQAGTAGRLPSVFLQNQVYPALRHVSATFTNLKFALRGPLPVEPKVAVVEIDSASIQALGRWPWRRDFLAYLIEKTFAAGARTVGLDIIFSEDEQRIPDELGALLKQMKLESLLAQFDTDSVMAKVIRKHADHLVLSWATETECRPRYSAPADCPITDPAYVSALPASFPKFALPQSPSEIQRTPLPAAPTVLSNLAAFDAASAHQGFANSFPDPDGVIRRASLLLMAGGRVYPSMPLEVARVTLGQSLESRFNGPMVRGLRLVPSGRELPVNAAGTTDVNFYGPSRSIPTVSASEVLREEPARAVASDPLAPLKDAAVLIGVTALAQGDIRATPFDSHVPGVEVQATILSNVLQGNLLDAGAGGSGTWLLLILLTAVAIVFERVAERSEARPVLMLFGLALTLLLLIDYWIFVYGHNWDTGLVYLEWTVLAGLTVMTKYVREEQKKKFLRTAFSKYVSPAVVDTLVHDPSKLSLGGSKRRLTVLFSDIRGFTSISETMDPGKLSELLNQYFSLMTGLVFQERGTLDKYVGDALMAFWGAPLDDPMQATHACDSARAMLRSLGQRQADFRRLFGHELRIGIGIHTGTASVGNMGSEISFGYTAIGDDVNLASRLESATKHYGVGILTSRATFDAIAASGQALPPHRVLDNVIVKGRTQAVEISEVLPDPLAADGLALFDEARSLYRARQWEKALRAFASADEKLGGDGPCRVYRERITRLIAQPPDAEWDGSWDLEGH